MDELVGVLPVVISSPGAQGSFFRTSVQLLNPRLPCPSPCVAPPDEPLIGRLIFHPSGTPGATTDPSVAYIIPPSSTLEISNVVTATGGTGIGSLDITSSSGFAPIVVTRVFNDAAAAGTMGMVEDTQRTADALVVGDRAFLILPGDTANFRANIGIRTLTPTTITTTWRAADGSLKGSRTDSYPQNYMEQRQALDFLTHDLVPRTIAVIGGGDTVTFDVTAGSAIIYAVGADNRTNDPSFQLARRAQ